MIKAAKVMSYCCFGRGCLAASPLNSPAGKKHLYATNRHLREIRPTVKRGKRFSRPQTGCYLPNTPWAGPGVIKLFPASESLVSDIPAGDGKTAILFLQC
jgi:hypothetical protein